MVEKNKIVGITGVDTRKLTGFIRDKGAPKGTVSFSKSKKFNIKNFCTLQKTGGIKQFRFGDKSIYKKNYTWAGYKTWKKEKVIRKA